MKYTLKPVTVASCDCQDCRAGRHLYELFRWQLDHWHWAGISLQTYASAEECKRHHFWGDFAPDDTWEDGTPIVEPTRMEHAPAKGAQSAAGGRGRLNTEALLKSYEALKRHWPT